MSCPQSTSGPRVRVYKHGNHSGPNHGIGHQYDNRCRKDCNICVHIQGISSYDVLDMPETIVPIGHYREDAYAHPMGHRNPPRLDYALALDGRQNLPGGWNDSMWGISFHTVPQPNANQLSYEIATNGIKKGGGERVIGPRDNTANRDDVKLRAGGSETGTPCPGGQGWFMRGGTKVRCLYSKTDDGPLRTLHSNKNGISSDPRSSMWETLATNFCNIPGNFTKNPGGQTCLERDSGSRIAKEYCKVGDRIKSDGACTQGNLGNFYAELAEAYCKTAAGKVDAWCSCYNVIKGVCDTDSTAAGCAKKRQTFDKLVEATPEEYKNSWSQMEPCFGGVCQGNVFQPAGYNSNCDRSIQMCIQDFDFQSMADSQINATCNLTSNRDTQPSAGDGGGTGGTPSYTPSGAPSGTTYPTGSTAATLDTSFRSKLPEFLRPYVPVSIDEVKTDSSKQLGVGGVGSLFMMCCCLLVIIVLATSGGGESGGRSMRFRR